MPEDIDNIRPVSPRFFGAVMANPGMSLTAKESLVNTALEGRLALESARSQIVKAQQDERLADLRIEKEEFMLADARKKAKREQDAIDRAGEMGDLLGSILDDPDLTDEEKRRGIARVRFDNADLFGSSRELQDQFKTALDILPDPPKPMSYSDMLAAERLRLYGAKADADFREKVRKEGKELAEDNLEFFQTEFDRAFKASLTDDGDIPGAATTRKFKDPADREYAIGLIRRYAPRAGIQLPDDLEGLSAEEIKRWVGRVYDRGANNLAREAGLGRSRDTGTNIPVQ